MGKEDEDTPLAAAALRDVVTLDDRILPVVGHGVEVEIERLSGEERVLAAKPGVPGDQELGSHGGRDARGIFREIALLRGAIEPAEQSQPRVGDQCHDVALAFDGPELEHQARAQCMACGDHLRAGQA
jgi:hypothetical protein